MQTREAWARGNYRFQVVAGMEVTAIEGHIIALYVEEPLPSLRPVEEVLEAVHRQDGLAIAAHPLMWLTRSLGERDLGRIAGSGREGVYLDGMETANQSPGAGLRLKRGQGELVRGEIRIVDVGVDRAFRLLDRVLMKRLGLHDEREQLREQQVRILRLKHEGRIRSDALEVCHCHFA